MTPARRLTTNCPPDALVFEGVRVPFFFEAGKGWRIRKRSLHFAVDYSTGIIDRAKARKRALAFLEEQRNGAAVKLSTSTLEDLVQCYLSMPRRASNVTANYNITQLRAICRTVLRRELKSIRVHEVRPDLWSRFMTIKCGGTLDLASRQLGNATINTAVRSAASIFKQTLRPGYRRAGFTIADDATEIEWLQELRRPPADLDETPLLQAWAQLPREALWWALGLARFVGLRKEEINACRGGWLEKRRGRWGLAVEDRPEEGFQCKTGVARFSVVLNAELLAALQALAPDELAVRLDSARDQWFKMVPQAWLRLYLGDRESVKKPLHRLRGLYLDEVRASAETRLQQAAVAEAAAAAGHTSTATTLAHYLSPK